MAAQADVLLAFGDGRYRFYLSLKAESEVERLCGNTPLGVIYEDMESSVGENRETGEIVYIPGGRARRHHAQHVIRIAAQYGGEAEIAGEVVKVSAIDATRLVENYVEGRPFDEVIPTAWAILQATLTGINLKKKDEPAESTSASTEAA